MGPGGEGPSRPPPPPPVSLVMQDSNDALADGTAALCERLRCGLCRQTLASGGTVYQRESQTLGGGSAQSTGRRGGGGDGETLGFSTEGKFSLTLRPSPCFYAWPLLNNTHYEKY